MMRKTEMKSRGKEYHREEDEQDDKVVEEQGEG